MIRRKRNVHVLALGIVGSLFAAAASQAAELKVLLPLGRMAYQTNEWVHVAVLRASGGPLAAGDLTLSLSGDDGSKAAFVFPVRAAAVQGKDARSTEHLYFNGWLLRPGHYKIEVGCDGAGASAEIDIASHLRKSTFRLMDWGNAQGPDLELLGEDSMGFNLMYGQYRFQHAAANADASVRGGLDFMQCCTMGGAHQMDIRLECDWSDPYVMRGGTARVAQQAFINRTAPNCIGVHFYDEPGLTWHKHPVTGEWTPHGIPAQVRAYKSAFGAEPIQYNDVKPDKAETVSRWEQFARWKLGFVDAAWREAAFGVAWVRPDYLSTNQSQYGWYAYADGYYFNVVRSLPVISGHGGYDDMPLGYHHPAYYFEFGRMRDLAKPAWYLPCWYGSTPPTHFRLEQYLSFMMNLQGLMTPPDMKVERPSACPTAWGIVESNQLEARLGTIFDTMPITRPEVAVLYSISQAHRAQVKDMKDNYNAGGHRDKLMYVYLASKLIHYSFFPVVEEDVLDGTLAANHKAVVLAGIDYLPTRVVKALETFAANGGLVLLTDDCQVAPNGAQKLGAPVDTSFSDELSKLWETGKHEELWARNLTGAHIKAVEPLAKALDAKLREAKLSPAFECDQPGIVSGRQAVGDIEYLFAANATWDEALGGKNSVRAAVATITLPDDGRPVYDAVLGGPAAAFKKEGKELKATLRFGAGQLRVFARTAKPIGSVQVATPVLVRDYTVESLPLRVDLAASVLDDKGGLLSASIPIEVRVTDPLGVARHALLRATRDGQFRASLPLAANDPPGDWKVSVRELLSNREGTAKLALAAPKQCGALAGAAPRAVFFKDDWQNVYRFFRTQRSVTIVKGKGDYEAAAKRIAEILKPWDVRCAAVNAADVAKPREIAEDEAKTWIGMVPGRAEPGGKNNPALVGFNVGGAVVLLGTPEDNPIIDFLSKNGFLPYKVSADFPGRGRGLVAWQRDGVGLGQESVTLIAYDAAGLGEAIGTMYEIAHGLAPLTPLTQPSDGSVAAAAKAPQVSSPAMKVAWEAVLPDRAAAIHALPKGPVVVLTYDGSLTAFDAAGKVAWQAAIPGGESWELAASDDGKLVAIGASQHLVGFDAAGKQKFDIPTMPDRPAPVATFVAVSADGSKIAAGTADGRVTLLAPTGERLWAAGGVPKADLDKWEAETAKWKEDVQKWEEDAKAWEKADEKARGKKPGKPAEPKKPVAAPYRAGLFAADGRTLIAASAKATDALALADGKLLGTIPEVNGMVQPVAAGPKLLMSDGKKALALVNPSNAKVLSKMEVPKEGIVGLLALPDGVLVVTESDQTVRKLKAAEGKAEEQTAWTYKLPRRIPRKAVAGGGMVAVAYWGGTLAVLDAAGKAAFAQALPQDIADLAWLGNRLIVGLADGRVLALEPAK